MYIPIEDCHKYINETIFQRGSQYFADGHIVSFHKDTSGNYDIEVSGTVNYHVCLTVKDKMVKQFSCDCPYDAGPVCKHIVAGIIAVKESQ